MASCCLKAQNIPSSRYRRFLSTKSLKGKEKRRYSMHVFWMEGFRSTDMLSCRDNGPGPPRCVLPAPRPPCSPSIYLPLSRNTRHILLETTPPAKSSLPAPRLFCFMPTLFPRHALTHWNGTGTHQRLQERGKRHAGLQCVQHAVAISHF